MPLRAVADGKTIIAPDLSDAEWAGLQLRHRSGLPVTMACCGAPGHLRVSKNGIRHFYHAADSGCHWAEESKEHLAIKQEIYRVCRSENWDATVEFPAPDRGWIADVYAERDGKKLVFEVQISPIPSGELEERDRKMRACGIEPYWLLEDYLGKKREFEQRYDSCLFQETGSPGDPIPYSDRSLFCTGTENHIFIATGTRTAGLDAGNQTLFTTGNKKIPLAVWVREVLKGNYGRYLDETAAAFHRRSRLLAMAAPALHRIRDFYETMIREKTCREMAGRCTRRVQSDPALAGNRNLSKKLQELHAEIDWVENEYRSCMAESAGLFVWRTVPGHARPRPYFLPGREADVQKLQDRVETFARWEASFREAIAGLERSVAGKKMKR